MDLKIFEYIEPLNLVDITEEDLEILIEEIVAMEISSDRNFIRRTLEDLIPYAEDNYFYTNVTLRDKKLIAENQIKVEALKHVPQPAQRSPEWYAMREGMLTASSIACIFNENPYQTRKKYLMEKCGFIKGFSGSEASEWGVKYEPVANEVYSNLYGKKVFEYGLIPHPVYKFLGASPDGITEDGVMIEIKVPSSREITGIPPRYYWVQMQIQMEVCDLQLCHFTELRIKEYSLEEEFWAMMDEDVNYTNILSQYHGCVLVFRDHIEDKNKYIHAPFEFTIDSLKEWIQKTIEETETDDLVFLNKSFWYVEKVSIVPVPRDREWFARSIPLIKDFYDEIQHFKAVGEEALHQKYPEKNPKDTFKPSSEKKKYKGYQTQYTFLED
jgi:putative phage-type endonuclease